MHTRTLILFFSVFTLSACSSVGSLLNFEDQPAPASAAVAAPLPPPAQPDDAWCQRVAASERGRAQQNGFDAATLDRMTLVAYQQCRTLAAG